MDDSLSFFYFSYALLLGATGVAYLKLRSTEGTVVTTKEFQLFQSGFLTVRACTACLRD
jgi:hypothetical protein